MADPLNRRQQFKKVEIVVPAYRNEITQYVPGKQVRCKVAGVSSRAAPRYHDLVNMTGTANLPCLEQARSYAERILWSSGHQP